MGERDSSAGTSAGGVRVFAVPGTPVPRRLFASARGIAPGGSGAVAIVLPGRVPLGVDELDLVDRAAAPRSAVVFVLTGPAPTGLGAGAGLDEAARRQRALLAEFAPGYEQCPIVSAATPEDEMRAVLAGAQRAAAAGDPDDELTADRAAADSARRHRIAER
ncbi:hypothetical protein, partial [Tomitella cavernea]